jgi:hypothetical protein
MKLYKLTDQDNFTKKHTHWEIGKTNAVAQENRVPLLCTVGVLHAYRSVELGLILNSFHEKITHPNIYDCEGKIAVEDYEKVGCYELTPTKKKRIPCWYNNKAIFSDVCIQFSVLCAELVVEIYNKRSPDDNRPQAAIDAAKKYLQKKTPDAAACYAAAAVAASYAAVAARIAHYDAGRAADAAVAAQYAAVAADDAQYAAYAAHYAARASDTKIDFDTLAKKAVKMILGRVA